MSTIQIDTHKSSQQRIVENFYTVLLEDIVEAEQLLEELDEDTKIEPNTYMSCRSLYDEEIAVGKFWGRENLLTLAQKHV